MQPLGNLLFWLRRVYNRYSAIRERETNTSALSKELEQFVAATKGAATRKIIRQELQPFLKIFDRYLYERANAKNFNWDMIKPPTGEQLIFYDQFSLPKDPAPLLNKLAVLKVNGGMGSTMGMDSAKSTLEVQSEMSFLDLTVQQIAHLNTTFQVDVPLIFMTSFSTHDDTIRGMKKHAHQPVHISTFTQSKFPSILKDTNLPYRATRNNEDDSGWYPPGHGDVYDSLIRSGTLQRLLTQGKEILFISSADNLGATVDLQILQQMAHSQTEFMMEVTDKRRDEMQGGTLVSCADKLTLLENTQAPSNCSNDFQSGHGLKHLNTGSLWINLRALKRVMESDHMELDVIANTKTTADGQVIVQLETSAGAAIKYFKRSIGIHVPRHRFLPVKTCSDLLLVKSNIFSLRHGQLCVSEERMFNTMPVIKLGDHFKKIQDFRKRFKQIPNIIDLDHLTVSGDVYFGKNITLRGAIIVIAPDGQQVYIPDGSVIENRLVSGHLTSTEL